jgi:hypothetical protein
MLPERRSWLFALFGMLPLMPAFGQEQPDSGSPPKEESTVQEELGERLIREASGEEDEDIMDRIVRLMNLSARRISVEFDVGPQTQEVQTRIMDSLETAIKQAAARRRPKRSRPRDRSADKREMTEGTSRPKGQTEEQTADATAESASDAARPGERPSGESADGGDLREARRTWGHLPLRERQEIIQGIGEQFLERYRDWIERYYRALQEIEE